MSPPILALPRTEARYTLDTDACDKLIKCFFLQEQEHGSNRLVGYWSRTLNEIQQKLPTTHREWLAVVQVATTLRPYLEGAGFTIQTDHEAPSCIIAMTKATGKLAQWHLNSSEFQFYIVH